jgi:hypothetical protein
MVAQLFRPQAPTLARIDIWLRLTGAALPKLPYLSYYITELTQDGAPDTEHPVMCAVPRPKPDIEPFASGTLIKCGVHATELQGRVDPNATHPLRANSSAWRPISLYINPEEAQLDPSKTYALVLQDCLIGECWLSASAAQHEDAAGSSDYEVGTHTTQGLGAMAFDGGSWHPAPGNTSVVAAFYTTASTAHGYRPNQLHEDWVSFHCNATAHEVGEMARVAKTIPAFNSTDEKTMDVLAYSGYGGLGLGDPSSTTHYGDLRQRYGVDWEVLTAAGLTVAMTGYGGPNITATQNQLRHGSTAHGRGSSVPPLVCGKIAGTQAEFAERYHTCDGVMEYDGVKSFDGSLGFRVPDTVATSSA